MMPILSSYAIQMNALMRAIPARRVAKLTTNAFFFVNSRHNLVIQIQMLPILNARKAQALEIGNPCKAFLLHPVREPVHHVFHDSIAEVHHRRTNLHVAATEQQKFHGVAPIGHAPNTAKR